jgi:hypothetical protein
MSEGGEEHGHEEEASAELNHYSAATEGSHSQTSSTK